jgi:hypothetical protein
VASLAGASCLPFSQHFAGEQTARLARVPRPELVFILSFASWLPKLDQLPHAACWRGRGDDMTRGHRAARNALRHRSMSAMSWARAACIFPVIYRRASQTRHRRALLATWLCEDEYPFIDTARANVATVQSPANAVSRYRTRPRRGIRPMPAALSADPISPSQLSAGPPIQRSLTREDKVCIVWNPLSFTRSSATIAAIFRRPAAGSWYGQTPRLPASAFCGAITRPARSSALWSISPRTPIRRGPYLGLFLFLSSPRFARRGWPAPKARPRVSTPFESSLISL